MIYYCGICEIAAWTFEFAYILISNLQKKKNRSMLHIASRICMSFGYRRSVPSFGGTVEFNLVYLYGLSSTWTWFISGF